MNARLPILSLFAILLFTGCASFNEAELGRIRQRGVSRQVLTKFEDGKVLSPQDVIELTRRHVPDSFIIRQIEDAGTDYVLSKADTKRLRAAGVSAAVLDALRSASDDFARGYYAPRYVTSYGVYADDPYGYYGPGSYYPYGSFGIGYYVPFHPHGHHWH